MRRRAFLRGAAAAAVVGAAGRVRQGLGQSRVHELPPGFALLRATQGEITIDGKTAIAVDGTDIAPLPGCVFELAVAQRIDLRVRIPRGPGAYPILAQGEGTDMLYHQAAGMMTVLRYEGFDDPVYDPRKSLAEFKH